MDEPQKHYLSKRNNIKNNTYFMIPFMQNVQNRQIYRDRKLINGYLGLRVGRRSNCL